MKDTDKVHFFRSEEIFDKAQSVFEEQKTILKSLFPNADIQHIGSCAIPGAISKFDIDIQIRITKDGFPDVISIMENNFEWKHPELRTADFAIFKNKTEPPIDFAVTVINSKHDHHYKTRDFLITNPDVLEKYNDLKKSFEGKPYGAYREAKISFIGKLQRENGFII